MGSVKDLVTDNSLAGQIYCPPIMKDFGLGTWRVKGTFSVRDLKKLIPPIEIKQKPEILAMTAAAFFEYLANTHPDIPMTYVGLLDNSGNIVDTQTLLDRGETSNLFVTRLAHVPETFAQQIGCNNASPKIQLRLYRQAIATGELECAVADVESIFRKGLPLGSSVFKKIFASVGRQAQYATLATYEQVVKGLDEIRAQVYAEGLNKYPDLEKILRDTVLVRIPFSITEAIPNPGFVLEKISYNSTSKFEAAGDRDLNREEWIALSGLDYEGYKIWTDDYFPRIAEAQLQFAKERGLLGMDGKCEVVAFMGKPVLTDFACTIDENRNLIVVDYEGKKLGLPANKEIQRLVFTANGVDVAINEAKERAKAAGALDNWHSYMEVVCGEQNVNLGAIARDSCILMEYAAAEVGNRTLGRKVFDAPPLRKWVDEFVPYASRIAYQEAA